MNSIILDNFNKIISDIQQLNSSTQLVAVSKFQPIEKILPLLEYGHRIFGESRVEEAYEKWSLLRDKYPNLELHFIGSIQSKKIKKIVNFFDVIESVDSINTLSKIIKYAEEINKTVRIFIQINIGNELQKSGINVDDLEDLFKKAISSKNIRLEGFMCIPPNTVEIEPYFIKMKELKSLYEVENLSMGMSNDYKKAIPIGANYIRIGSYIFGDRNYS
ncbi:YggS family pyridoxal phosphate-dependent enzyme [Acinetobacter baumannii]|uniref:YggS family pyridoxal phosphate-dependent enzyme n=1 Tax=Acinetobacter baumannii TaxID=470 RepID=UPI000D0ADDBC|nr:YggS family pyridoxal phosphate-dependent enzyme [Acinetobacter baumannii]EHU1557915.1 YggS family pyridoxal phosphate-dependent enzyme [Acinetobacter baumannii]MDC4559690.1 YggS family pyridoxal phosphate-dependent enzyme [Acinetobacter baumannii]MDC5587037.1 YggS family pyridoxal phosphate-dependent enzyme [Acinetobacter baumannii]MDC5611718.1 YggS family pyridoxal phosphate-dependent enzyme [Acinetobacter baumannii]MDH2467329.1 YggS family pyridoxal phosphate-dependent enzyme [Acinetobac